VNTAGIMETFVIAKTDIEKDLARFSKDQKSTSPEGIVAHLD